MAFEPFKFPFFKPYFSLHQTLLMTDASTLTPITVITGFLGAGKTTLVNYILKEQKDWKIAVLENEFGEVSLLSMFRDPLPTFKKLIDHLLPQVAIDDGLVAEQMDAPEDLITMDNGCVCCSIRGDLIRTLGQLATRRHEFNAIVLETTGVADPAPIVYTIQTNPKMSAHYKIDSIVCLADAKHVEIHLDDVKPDGDVNEALQQVAFADKILLNKLDLVTPEEKMRVKTRIQSINKFAEIIETERSRAPLDKILGCDGFNMESILTVDPDFFEDDDENKKKHNTDLVQSVGVR